MNKEEDSTFVLLLSNALLNPAWKGQVFAIPAHSQNHNIKQVEKVGVRMGREGLAGTGVCSHIWDKHKGQLRRLIRKSLSVRLALVLPKKNHPKI